MDLLLSNGSVVYTGTDFSGIYAIQNNINGKWYVGESANVLNRIKAYRSDRCKRQPLIHNAIKKYGIENFTFYKLEECDSEVLLEREVYWGQKLNSLSPNGYNLKLGGNTKIIVSQETRNKIGIAHKGKFISDITRIRISNSKKGSEPWNKGKTGVQCWSDKSKKKASLSHIGNKNAVGNTHNRGRTHTAQNKLKISNGIKLTKLIKWLEKEAPWFCETT